MDWRKTLGEARRRFTVAAAILGGAAAAAAIAYFTPNRTAAVLLGLLGAAAFCFLYLSRKERSTQAAALWFALGVTADAAYAKLNDVAPVTIAGALMKIVDAVVKLGDSMLRSAVAIPPDARAKISAVTPDFVWALILGVVAFMIIERLSRASRP
ncbi:MAG: hypothetical protein NW215_11675 [Hyphomicrobiales bacterium]|nr:hypothetical protein [Hyphomicrobiales bacterium]